MSQCQKFPQDDTLLPKLDSLSCAELLKKNVPTSKALLSLRMMIQQQKLMRVTPAPGDKIDIILPETFAGWQTKVCIVTELYGI